MNKKYAQYLLNKTRQDYNRMAMLFSIKRERLTPDILYLKKYARSGDKVLDLGCGSGRLNKLFAGVDGIDYTGTDVSQGLISIAKKKYPDRRFILTDFFKLPFKKKTYDKIFCLSVIHHIPSAELRQKFLHEARRVLKPNGRLIITAWSVWDNKKVKRINLKFKLRRILFLTKMDKNDIFLPFRDNRGKILAQRYLHCFKKQELLQLIKRAGFKIEKAVALKRGKSGENKNILAIVKKRQD
jgi:ubiquinone/menaquinone biosynthesis C-methylase UbiE